jgi:site-specific recombinase XerD
MAKSPLRLVTPATVKRTVTPRRLPNAKLRTREHLTEAEVERLMAAAKKNRWSHRDATMVLMAHRHSLPAPECYALANRGHDTRALQAYLGHRNIQHTVRYTELSPTRFKDFWRSQ